MTNDIEQLKEALKSANDMCRSAMSIVEREGSSTNWSAFKKQLQESLELQHNAMYPNQYIEEKVVNVSGN